MTLARLQHRAKHQMAGRLSTTKKPPGPAGEQPQMDHGVSHTALLICAHRVRESRRRDALFSDPVAEVFANEVRARVLRFSVCMHAGR